jgi:putative flippase GtrA
VNSKPYFEDVTGKVRRFATFAAVGILGTAAHYAVLVALVEWMKVAPTVSTGLGFAVGAIVNYCLNYRVTFASNLRHAHTAPRFFAIAAVGGVLNVFLMHVGTVMLSLHYIVSQVLATGIVLILNFIANSVWTFATQVDSKQ